MDDIHSIKQQKRVYVRISFLNNVKISTFILRMSSPKFCIEKKVVNYTLYPYAYTFTPTNHR